MAKSHLKQVEWILSLQDDFIDEAVRALTTEIQAELQQSTPVKTGWAASNWLATLSKPATTSVGSKESVNKTSAPGRVARVTAAFDAKKHRRVYLTNHVPYVMSLNDGTTKTHKAPIGFIQMSITRGVNRTESAMRRYKPSALKGR